MTVQSVFQIEVAISQDWRDIELLRTSVLNCLAAVFHESEFCATTGMITGELLENALKFGQWGFGDEAPLRMRVFGDRRSVAIEVSNPIGPERSSLQPLFETLERLNAAPDRRLLFLERLAEVAARPPELLATKSG